MCNNWRRTSWNTIACANLTRVHTGSSLLQLDNELLSKRTRNWLRKNDEPSAPRTETSWMLKGCYYQRKPMRCLWRRTYVSIPGRRQLMRRPREITMRTWINWMRSKTSFPLRRLDPRLSYTWLGTIPGQSHLDMICYFRWANIRKAIWLWYDLTRGKSWSIIDLEPS